MPLFACRNLSRVVLVFVVPIILLAAVGCTDEPSPTPTPDPRIDELQRLVEELGTTVETLDRRLAILDNTPTPTPTPSATMTPTRTATPGPTLEEIASLIESAVSGAIAAQRTPVPSIGDIQELIDRSVGDAVAALPTPVPTTTPFPSPTPISLSSLVSIVPQVFGPAFTPLNGDVTLKVEPGQLLTGRDISFTLNGLEPWQNVDIEFIDPLGRPSEWITENEARFRFVNNAPVTERTLVADENGVLRWTRIGTNDVEGVWSVRIALGGASTRVSYPISELQLRSQETEFVGVELRKHQGFLSDVFFSAGVPVSLAVDLQAHLAVVVSRLQSEFGIRSRQIPDIYLAADQGALDQIAEAVDIDLGFEAGWYSVSGVRPGIYMRTDFLRTAVQRLLTHEYVHLVLQEVAGDASLPAWLNEGMAEFIELEFGLHGERPDVSRRQLFASADRAKDAAIQGALIPLDSLESQRAWNSRSDDVLVSLQYAESHMLMRYLTENYGKQSPLDMVRAISGGQTFEGAIESAIGFTQLELQNSYNDWLKTWGNPVRTEVRDYVDELNEIMDAQNAITERRQVDIDARLSRNQRLANSTEFLEDAQALSLRLAALEPLSEVQGLHEVALAFLNTLENWLATELEFVRTGADSKRVDANNMIPEVNGRETLVFQGIGNTEFNFWLNQ